MQMKCIVPFVKDLVSNQPKSWTRKDKRDDRKKRAKRRKKSLEKNTRNLLSLILKSTPSHSGSYHILDRGDFPKPPVTKSNLNIENLNSKVHVEPLWELLAKGYVDNVNENLKMVVMMIVLMNLMMMMMMILMMMRMTMRMTMTILNDDDDDGNHDGDDNSD